MSPEQAAGQPVDGRSDLYSLGVTAYYALTGQYPFQAESNAGLILQHLNAPPTPLRELRSGMPHGLVLAIERCLAKAPDERFANAEALADALGAALARPTSSPAVLRSAQEAESLVYEAGGYVAIVAMILAQVAAIQFKLLPLDGFAGFFNAIALAVMGFLLLVRASTLMGRLREAGMEGFLPADLVNAHAELEETHRAPAGSRLGRGLLLAGGFVLASWGWLNDLNGLLTPFQFPFALGELALAFVVGRATVRGLLRSRGVGFWRRFWSGKLGRALYGFARLGLPKGLRATPVVDAPTEIALGEAATALYDALPPEARSTLGDVRGVIARLEREAQRLRREELERAQVADEPGRARAAARLAQAVAALENLRLDLLRAAAGSVDTGLTADLEAARKVADLVDGMRSDE